MIPFREAEELLERCAAVVRSIIATSSQIGDLEFPESTQVSVYGFFLDSPPPPSRFSLRSQMSLVISGADVTWAYAYSDGYDDPSSRTPSDAALAFGQQLVDLAEPYKPIWPFHKVVVSLQNGPDLT